MLFLRVSARPDLVGIRVGTLDDPSWFRPDADIFVDVQTFDLMEHWRVARVWRIIAVDLAGDNDANRRTHLFHGANLHWGSVRPQE